MGLGAQVSALRRWRVPAHPSCIVLEEPALVLSSAVPSNRTINQSGSPVAAAEWGNPTI